MVPSVNMHSQEELVWAWVMMGDLDGMSKGVGLREEVGGWFGEEEDDEGGGQEEGYGPEEEEELGPSIELEHGLGEGVEPKSEECQRGRDAV